MQVISPRIELDVAAELRKLNFLTIITDTSNHKALKMLPVIVRGFSEEKGVQSFKLEVKLIPNERSETIGNVLFQTGTRFQIVDKIVAFGADNCNTNYGGVSRKGENNVFFRLKQLFNREIVGVGCVSHIIHNAFDAACETLTIQVEPLAVVMYNHFKLHTVRTELLKQFCDEAQVMHTRLQSHSGTRFLTLHLAISKVISSVEYNCFIF